MSGDRGETRLAVEGLTIAAGGRRLAGPVDLSLSAGRCLSVVGETGAGKSLIAQALLGMLPDGVTADGKIALDGHRIDQLAPPARASLWGHTLSLLPQEPWCALDPTMRAFAQVRETHRYVAGLDGPAAGAATAGDFATLGLKGAEGKLPGALSGGMAQRVAFAAARAGGAPILLADEPTKGLDAALRDDVVRLLREAMQAGAALLVITHDIAVARGLGGDLLILRDGRVMEAGRTETVLSGPRSDYGRVLVASDPALWPARKPVPAGEVVLGTRSLAIERGGHRLVDGLALEVRAGERIAVEGPSGCGKTSLLDALAGLLKPASGSVQRAPGVTALGVQKLYQDPPAAFPPLVSLGRVLADLARRHAIDRTRIDALLKRLRVPLDLLERRPDAVSGGELQRIALARILALRPRVILADEPTSRLDPVTQRDVMALIAEVAEESRAAVVLVTHEPTIAARWADRRLRLGLLSAPAPV